MSDRMKIRNLWLFQFLADFCSIIVAYFLTYFFRFHSDIGERFFTFVNRATGIRETGFIGGPYKDFYVVSAPRIILILIITLSILYALMDLYSGRRFIRKRPVAWHIVIGNMAALVLFYTYFYLSRNVFHPRSYFVTVIFFNTIFCIWFRYFMSGLLGLLRSRFLIDQYSAVMVGDNKDADYLNRLVDAFHPHGLTIVDCINSQQGRSFDDLLNAVDEASTRNKADMLIVADTSFSIEQIMRFLELGDNQEMSVKILSDKMDVLSNQARISVDMVHGIPLVHFDAPHDRIRRGEIAQVLNRVTAVLLLLIAALPMLFIMLLIKLTSRGPVFFVQERMGVNRKPFSMYKFRTMYERADEAQAQLEEFNESGEGLFKIKKDPRVTSVGRFLRRFSLDELPQLWNVIKGEMMIVGPRPLPRRDFENYYEDWHYSRHGGLPGLTCLWQVSGRSEIDFHNMCLLDVYYLRNHSWVLDIKIFIKTFWVVLFGRGAY